MYQKNRESSRAPRILVGSLALALLATACGGDETGDESPESSVTGEQDSDEDEAPAASDDEDTADGSDEDEYADWPERPITLALVSPAGGGTDRALRPTAQAMEDELGVAVSVTDMSGASGANAAGWVQEQPADGYAWVGQAEFIEVNAILDQFDHLYDDYWNYVVAGAPIIFAVPADSPFEDFGDFLDAVEQDPGEITVGTAQPGGTHHMSTSLLNHVLDDAFSLIPYEGGGPAVRAAAGEEVDAVVLATPPIIPFAESGDITPLVAFTEDEYDLEGYGSVPSVTEYMDDPRVTDVLPLTNIFLISVLRDTPEPILERIDEAWANVVASEELQDDLAGNGFIQFALDRHESDERLKSRTEFTAWMFEDVLGIAERTRDELGIEPYEGQ